MRRAAVGIAAIALAVCQGTPSQATPPPIDVSGSQVLFIHDTDLDTLPHTYVDVLPDPYPNIDARLSLVSNDGTFPQYYDMTGGDESEDAGVFLELDSGDGKLTLQVEFLSEGSPVELSSLCINVVDIDWQQFVEFQGASSYAITSNSNLTVTQSGNTLRAEETAGEGSEYEDPENWVEVSYGTTSSVIFSVGLQDGDGGSFLLRFGCASWPDPSNVVVTPLSASLRLPGLDLEFYKERLESEQLPDTM